MGEQPHDDSVLRVVPDRYVPGAFVVAGGGVEHSFVDPADPTHVEFPYMERICELIDLWAPAGERFRVVHVGGAGMTLARYVAHTRPTSPQIVLEPDAGLTAEVREKLPLPPRSGIKVRAQDGRTGLAAMPADYAEMIIVDAFTDLSVPGELVTAQAFAEYARVLTPRGVVVLNVTDTRPFSWARGVLAGAATCFSEQAVSSEPAILKGRRMGNLVMLASNRRLPMEDLLRRGASAVFPYRWIQPDEMTRWRGRVEPFDDTAPVPSPISGDARTRFS